MLDEYRYSETRWGCQQSDKAHLVSLVESDSLEALQQTVSIEHQSPQNANKK